MIWISLFFKHLCDNFLLSCFLSVYLEHRDGTVELLVLALSCFNLLFEFILLLVLMDPATDLLAAKLFINIKLSYIVINLSALFLVT